MAAVVILGAAVGLAAWQFSGGGSSGGFNNVSTLENSVQSTYQDKISSANSSISVTDVSCIAVGNRQFNCVLELSTGQSVSHHITVSSSGDHWVSDNTP